MARIGLFCLITFALAAIFAPFVAPFDPHQIVGDVWAPITSQFWLGTDQLGRDILSRLIHGARNTFFIAGAATLISFSMGTFLGFLAAVTGGKMDQLLSRANDLMMAIPTLIFALVSALSTTCQYDSN